MNANTHISRMDKMASVLPYMSQSAHISLSLETSQHHVEDSKELA